MDAAPVGDILHRNNVKVSGRSGGPVLMFAHGFGCSQEAWNLVSPDFERDHTVVLFDHVGAGNSDVTVYDPGKYDSLHGYSSDVIEIVDALDLTDVTFIGHSVSAMIGVLAVNRAPQRFRSLVLVSPSPRYVDDVEYIGGFGRADIDALLASLEANYLGWSRETAPMIMGTPDRPDLGDRLTESFCRVDPHIAADFARVTFLSDNRSDLAQVPVPALVIQSLDDAIAPLDVGRYVHDALPDSEFAVIGTTGHVPILSAPDDVIREIRQFLS